MFDIRKYSNGKFFDAVNKKYINGDHIKELIKTGEQIKVTLTTTGEEITEAVLSKYGVKTRSQKIDPEKTDSEQMGSVAADSSNRERLLNREGMKHWVSALIDKRIKQVLEIINLPTRDQIAELNANINTINQKIDALSAKRDSRDSNGEIFNVILSESELKSDTLSESDALLADPSVIEASQPDNKELFSEENNSEERVLESDKLTDSKSFTDSDTMVLSESILVNPDFTSDMESEAISDPETQQKKILLRRIVQ